MPFLSLGVSAAATGKVHSAHPTDFPKWWDFRVSGGPSTTGGLFGPFPSAALYSVLSPFAVGAVARTVEDGKHLYVLFRQGEFLGRQVVRVSKMRGSPRPPNTLRDARVGNAYASSAVVRTPGATPPCRCNVCFALGAAKGRTAFIDAYKARCHPMSACEDISACGPWRADMSRAPLGELAFLWVKKHLAPANAPGLEDVAG